MLLNLVGSSDEAAVSNNTSNILSMEEIEAINLIAYKQEGSVLFNYALNTFYLQLYDVRHMVKDHSDSERGNLLPTHGLLFPISSKGSFICAIPQT